MKFYNFYKGKNHEIFFIELLTCFYLKNEKTSLILSDPNKILKNHIILLTSFKGPNDKIYTEFSNFYLAKLTNPSKLC